MHMTISAAEWRMVLGRARDVGVAMGAEQAAMIAARTALETVGITVPVIDDELDAVSTTPPPRAAPADTVATHRDVAPPVAETPGKDLRRSARVPSEADGYCPHCDVVYGAAALAVLDDGNRLCPVHGTVTRGVAEVSEGRFTVERAPGQPRARRSARDAGGDLCGAPIGGEPCAEPSGHNGRHRPLPRRRDEVAG